MKYLFFLILIISTLYIYGQKTDSLLNKQTDYSQEIENIEIKIDNQNDLIKGLNEQIKEFDEKNNTEMYVSIISLLIALSLLIITFQNNRNNQKILQEQINEQKIINRAQQRPIVDAYRSGWKEKTELIMINYGQGPAILKEIYFEKEGFKPTKTISDLIDIKKIDKDIWWDDKWNYNEKDYYLYPQQKEKIYSVTKENLIEKYGKSGVEAERIIKEVRKARSGISFKVKYTDLISIDNNDSAKNYSLNIKIYNE